MFASSAWRFVSRQSQRSIRASGIASSRRRYHLTNTVRASDGKRSAVGIDLGTTQSCVAVYANGEAKVLPGPDGLTTVPSVVALRPGQDDLVGKPALQQALTNAKGTFAATKRLVGRLHSDPLVGVAQSQCSYDIVEADNGEAWVMDPRTGTAISPSQIAASILQHMRNVAEAALGTEVADVVVTVPAYFNDNQRQATRNAGALAGLNVLRVVNEPTAAALAYGFGAHSIPEGKTAATVAVYDLGGGTFDVSVLKVDRDGTFEVLSTNGDTFLGGEDVDAAVAKHLQSKAEKQGIVGGDIDGTAVSRLKHAAERAKIELDSADTAEVNVPFLAAGKSFSTTLTRSDFDAIVAPVLHRTSHPCAQALSDAGVSSSDIDEVLLVGGMTRSACVRRFVERIFGQVPNTKINPIEAVATGAAIQAGVLSGQVDNVLLLDVTPLSLGVETLGGLVDVLIPRNTSIPTRESRVFSTGVDNQSQVALRILQGERPLAQDNQLLGEITLVDIEPAPKGQPRISVTFDVDADGILKVSGTDDATGKTQRIEVRSSGGLSAAEIQRLIDEAQASKGDDARRAKRASATISEVEGLLKAYSQLLEVADVADLQAQLASVNADLANLDIDEKELGERAAQLLSSTVVAFRKKMKT